MEDVESADHQKNIHLAFSWIRDSEEIIEGASESMSEDDIEKYILELEKYVIDPEEVHQLTVIQMKECYREMNFWKNFLNISRKLKKIT